jgi:hypothetical protein
MKNYYFENNEFVIENYHTKKTFSSFLPGLAGKRGIPLWAFYVNRGQGISSFGIENKDRHILEFDPAVLAYKNVGIKGFRTFIKKNGKVVEIFGENDLKTKRTMRIKRSEFTIEELNEELALKTTVTYFGLPNENVAALCRVVTFENLSDQPQHLEVLDGLSQLLPTGLSLGDMKNLANLMRSWMEVYALEKQVGFFRMRSSTADQAEMVEIKNGNFYVSSFNDQLVTPIVDANLVFGYDTSQRRARRFEQVSVQDIDYLNQVTANKIPVGFTGVEMKLEANQTARINTVIGSIYSEEYLYEVKDKLATTSFIDQKRKEAAQVLDEMLDEVQTVSNYPIFDEYIKQNYLDNILRGGYPMILEGEENNMVYHLFSRRHGDLERDYNYFTIAPEYYSQGNGSFRDVCQNRRSDVLMNPRVDAFNVRMFGSLIQCDGYNPLSIDGSTFVIEDLFHRERIIKDIFKGNEIMSHLLSHPFTPGSVINTMANHGIETSLSDAELLHQIFQYATQRFEAHFAEGYWIDHWTYILDLVENFEAIYPDRIYPELYRNREYKYFDSPVTVLPRDEKICLTKDGKVRRFGSTLHFDVEKVETVKFDPHRAYWLRTKQGSTIYGTLFEKLFVLMMNKVATLDPSGMGIEMEADKPGWNDAMNGLPGLFGSGISETIELKRVSRYLADHFDQTETYQFPVEFTEFTQSMIHVLEDEIDDFAYWNKANDVKEIYRKDIRFGSKQIENIPAEMIKKALKLVDNKVDMALNKAYRFGGGIYPTYLVHEVTDYEPNMENNAPKIGNYGLPTVSPKSFVVRALPFYLEAPARAMKISKNKGNLAQMYTRIKQSNIYDHELKFYKTSEFLDKESNEIGRGRSFTKGWQERESNFLHMTYKYLLGLLKAGLYDEFYEEIKTNLTCFMDPEVYGRSTLENSSFIASSINPDPEVRGQGFVARLSGSTAEMLSIWAYMMYGKNPFVTEKNELTLNLQPKLHHSFFKNQELTFEFLGSTKVTYINQHDINTYDASFRIKHYELDGVEYQIIQGEVAEQLRQGKFKQLRVYF